MNNKVINKNKLSNDHKMALDLGLDPSKIISKTSNKTTSINGDCKELEACRKEMQQVYIKHTKVYRFETLRLGKNGEVIKEIKTIRGFIDKHPTKDNIDCVRELNIFAPYSETKVIPCYKSQVQVIED